MNELQSSRMKRNSIDATFRGFLMAILPVADHRMAERRELHTNLVLQSRHQRNP